MKPYNILLMFLHVFELCLISKVSVHIHTVDVVMVALLGFFNGPAADIDMIPVVFELFLLIMIYHHS